jgi:hypothetical protein
MLGYLCKNDMLVLGYLCNIVLLVLVVIYMMCLLSMILQVNVWVMYDALLECFGYLGCCK